MTSRTIKGKKNKDQKDKPKDTMKGGLIPYWEKRPERSSYSLEEMREAAKRLGYVQSEDDPSLWVTSQKWIRE